MSDSVAPLGTETFVGIAEIKPLGLQGLIAVRGDLQTQFLGDAIKQVMNIAIPGVRGVVFTGNDGVGWISPDELLLFCDHEKVAARVDELRELLGDRHTLVLTVSDERVIFSVSGVRSREVMAKLCPVDFSPTEFTSGMIRRTRMAQIAATIWLSKHDTFEIIVMRSVAQYAFDLLRVAASEGSEVDLW
ncbi:MAG: sarcosine oxidase subunit gamma [Aestuariivita sp.]|nr:sarcosine oxidase subunit gamma [Aestuariivita sp.]MCY4203687.1 sarcosine oxidase subunit gamma [Aestuariivita sp.]MCY4287019.1 sarcosine oxidase subunit gamma [Aestuariivita sp.]MCY4347666.1 sarcosine oxidase subunit gamma [Aestuariivita sp.]